MRKPYVFLKDENLKRFLLAKLINAERATLKSPSFNAFTKKTIQPELEKLCDDLENLTNSFYSLTNLSKCDTASKAILNESSKSSSKMENVLKPMRRLSTQVMHSVHLSTGLTDSSKPSSKMKNVFKPMRRLSNQVMHGVHHASEGRTLSLAKVRFEIRCLFKLVVFLLPKKASRNDSIDSAQNACNEDRKQSSGNDDVFEVTK